MKLTARQIERLVKQGEVVHTECKDASGGLPDSLWESYSAFANTDGGVILLGAKEVDGKFSIADYHGRRGIVIEKQAQTISFSNPGVFRVNKAVAVEGGTSDARNSHIFNIFALVDIGERSGMGLADLYGHWKKHGLPEPVISEEYDPDRVKVTVYTDPAQGTANRPKSAPKMAQSAPRVPQIDPSFAQNRPKPGAESAQAQSAIGPRQDGFEQSFPLELRDEIASVRQVYKAIVANPKATYRGLAAQLDFAKDTIGRAIATLIRLKIIRREGNKQTGHWEVVK